MVGCDEVTPTPTPMPTSMPTFTPMPNAQSIIDQSKIVMFPLCFVHLYYLLLSKICIICSLYGLENVVFFDLNNFSKMSLICFMFLGKIEVITILFLISRFIFRE